MVSARGTHRLKKYQMLKLTRFLLYLIYILSKVPRLTTLILILLRPFYVPLKETFLNRKLRYGLLTFGGGKLPPDILKAYGYGAKAVLDNINEVLKSDKNGDPIIWVEWILNAELLEAFNVTSFNPAILNVFGNVHGADGPSSLIAAAESRGIPLEYCSAMKCDMGAWFLDQLPDPALTIVGSHPCDTNVSINQSFEYLLGVPSFIFDVPYWKDAYSYDYFAKQVHEQIDFLEKKLDRKIDWQKFKEMMERMNKFNSYLMEISEMHRATPCPGSHFNLVFAWVIRELNVRSPHALLMAEHMHRAIKKRYLAGKSVAKKEKIRVLLWFPPIAFFSYLFHWMEEEFGAVVVADFIGNVSTVHIDTSSRESMIRDFARTQMHLAMGRQCHGPVEFITHEMEEAIDAYNVDCMIFTGHQGCKHGWAALKIIKDICKKRNLPTLYLSIDIMDQRYLDEAGLRDEVRSFFQKHGWA